MMRKRLSKRLEKGFLVCLVAGILAASWPVSGNIKPICGVGNFSGSCVKAAESSVFVLGESLSDQQKLTVLQYLGVTPDALGSYTVLTETTDMLQQEDATEDSTTEDPTTERQAMLGVVVKAGEEGSGIQVNTDNLSGTSSGLLKNAFQTMGMKDIEVTIAAPYPVDGANAVFYVSQGYTALTGEEVSQESVLAAYSEIRETSSLEADSKTGELMVTLVEKLKEKLADGTMKTDDEIRDNIAQFADQLGITLTTEQTDRILGIMHTLQNVGWGLGQLAAQGESIYAESGSEAVNHPDQALSSYLTKKIQNFFQNLIQDIGKGITSWFQGLLSGKGDAAMGDTGTPTGTATMETVQSAGESG